MNSADGKKVTTFESAVLKKEEVAIALKIFRCLKFDIARDKVAKEVYGDKVPLFLAYDASGKLVEELHVPDYKCNSTALMGLLVKATRGHGKLPLKTFIKKYRDFLGDLDKLEGKKDVLTKKKQRLLGTPPAAAAAGKPAATAKPPAKPLSGRDQARLKGIEKEEADLAEQEKKLMAEEQQILADAKVYDPARPSEEDAKKAAAAAGGG
ncbi:MAG: hypothetical protein JXQ29_15340 [Planctomycetes bacterium]|nr:hypothetical protein [Planctomycetota bacterium]